MNLKSIICILLSLTMLFLVCGCGAEINIEINSSQPSSEVLDTITSEHTSQPQVSSSSKPSVSSPSSSKPTSSVVSGPSKVSSSASSQITSSTVSNTPLAKPVDGWDELGNILIFGDSYSAFHKDGIDDKYPYGNKPYYPNDIDDVDDLEDMWFSHLLKETKGQIVRNDSLSGASICGTSYGQDTYNGGNGWCFSARLEKLIKEGYFSKNKIDTIFIFGGTNDVGVTPIGQLKYSGWSESDILKPLPGASYFMNTLRRNVPRSTKIYFVLNNSIKTSNPTLYEGYKEYCKKWAIGFIECSTIAKASGHPTAAGMKTISDDIVKYLKTNPIP